MSTEKEQFAKKLILSQLEAHIHSMFKVQTREIWELLVQPKTPTLEDMHRDILAILSEKSLDEISQFIMENKPRKQRGMNGGRRKVIVES